MAATIRPYKKAKKLAYNLLKTPKNMQQYAQPNPGERRIKEWAKDTAGSAQ
jgi:hypothetical protein